MPSELLPVLILFVIIGVPVICGTLVKLAKVIKGDGSESSTVHSKNIRTDEARMLQEMHRGLGRLEDRINSLETIVLERERRNDRTQS